MAATESLLRERVEQSAFTISVIDDFDRFGSLHRRFWIVYSQPEYLERSLRAAIEQSCVSPRVFSGTLDGGDVVVCDAFVEPRAAWRVGGLP